MTEKEGDCFAPPVINLIMEDYVLEFQELLRHELRVSGSYHYCVKFGRHNIFSS